MVFTFYIINAFSAWYGCFCNWGKQLLVFCVVFWGFVNTSSHLILVCLGENLMNGGRKHLHRVSLIGDFSLKVSGKPLQAFARGSTQKWKAQGHPLSFQNFIEKKWREKS